MLQNVDFVSVLSPLFDDLTVVLPIALSVLASLWAVRLAISYFKGVSNDKEANDSYLDDLEDSGYFQKEYAELEADKEWLVQNDKEWKELTARWEKVKDGYI